MVMLVEIPHLVTFQNSEPEEVSKLRKIYEEFPLESENECQKFN